MRQRYCRVCHGWHDVEKWPRRCVPDHRLSASNLPAPQIISDTMEPVQSQLDGRIYDSKSRLRRTYRDAGVAEVGNSVAAPERKAPTVDRQAVKRSVSKAFSQAGLGC